MLEDYSWCVVPTQHCRYPPLSPHYCVCRHCQSSGWCSKRHTLCYSGTPVLISASSSFFFFSYKTEIFFYCPFFFKFLLLFICARIRCTCIWVHTLARRRFWFPGAEDTGGWWDLTVVFCKSSTNSTIPLLLKLHLSHARHKASIIREPVHIGITKSYCTSSWVSCGLKLGQSKPSCH